jgi:hypothetical protein
MVALQTSSLIERNGRCLKLDAFWIWDWVKLSIPPVIRVPDRP